MIAARVSEKDQVVIPKEIREKFKIKSGDTKYCPL
jgi:AbrB family looped-hinge helix DNA binding protein